MIDSTVKEILDLYRHFGEADYIGEPVSQIEHMGQAALLAMKEGHKDEVVLAAFFHDIGHLLEFDDPDRRMGQFGVIDHENLGAEYLASKGFSTEITNLIRDHVRAKRYLTFKHPAYYQSLSEASKNTLKHQGGKMDQKEAIAFEKEAWFELSIKLRRWDEAAKLKNVPLIDLGIIQEKCLKHLRERSAID